MTVRTAGFHHVSMVTSDAPRSIRFYRDVLGLALVDQETGAADPESYRLQFGDEHGSPGTLLTFFEWVGARRGRWGLGGIHHVALGTETQETQIQWKRRLLDAGARVSGPYDRKWFHSIYFTDPDGQVLEIATRGPGYAVDESADALGSSVIMPGDARIRGHRDEAMIAAINWPEPVDDITEAMRLQGIHHVTGITGDVERLGEFYESALGLRLVKRSVNQDDETTPHWFWANYDGKSVAPHSSLTMFGWKDSPYTARPGSGQTHSIAFRAEDDAQLLAWREHLLGLDLEVSDVVDRTHFRSVYFRAPDGLLMEIATDGPRFTGR